MAPLYRHHAAAAASSTHLFNRIRNDASVAVADSSRRDMSVSIHSKSAKNAATRCCGTSTQTSQLCPSPSSAVKSEEFSVSSVLVMFDAFSGRRQARLSPTSLKCLPYSYSQVCHPLDNNADCPIYCRQNCPARCPCHTSRSRNR